MAVIATTVLSELATYTAANEISSTPASYLKIPHPRWKLMVTGTLLDVTVDLSAALASYATTGISSYRLIYLGYCKVTPTATVQVDLSAGIGLPLPGYTYNFNFYKSTDQSRRLWVWRDTWLWLPEQHSESYIRVRVTDTANTDGTMEIGQLVIHPGYKPALPLLARPSVALEGEQREIDAQGSRHPQELPLYESRHFVMQATGNGANAEVHGQWIDLQREVGFARPAVVIMDETATTYAMNEVCFGTLTALPPVLLAESWRYAELELTAKELASRR